MNATMTDRKPRFTDRKLRSVEKTVEDIEDSGRAVDWELTEDDVLRIHSIGDKKFEPAMEFSHPNSACAFLDSSFIFWKEGYETGRINNIGG